MADQTAITALSPLEVDHLGGDRIEFSGSMPYDRTNTIRLPGFEGLSASGVYGQMQFQHAAGAGFDIWYSNYAMSRPAAFMARGDFPALELHIPFGSSPLSWWDGQKERTLLDNQFDLSYYPFINSRTRFAPGRQYHTFDIHYSVPFLERYAVHFAPLAAFLEKVEKGQRADLLPSPRFLSPGMISLVDGALHLEASEKTAGFYYDHFAHLLLVDLLIRAGDAQGPPKIKFTAFDLERTMVAREMITGNLGKLYSITELARATGFNEWKLQHTFKHLFGTTIFAYSRNARLDQAKYLLRHTTDPIHSIAIRCGYSDHSNLTAAFKNKFGYTPEYFRAQKK
jgi:AraC-like DNA-binding protein